MALAIVGGLVGVGLILLALRNGPNVSVREQEASTGGYLLRDDFNDGTGDFSTASDDTVTLDYVGGAYRILVRDPNNLSPFYRSWFPTSVETVSVEADVTEQASSSPENATATGVSCWGSEKTGYALAVSPDKHFELVAIGEGTLLAQGSNDAIQSRGQTNHLRLDCVGGGALPTHLTAYVNGTKLVEADDELYHSFMGVGLAVFGPARTEVLFDNVTARRLTGSPGTADTGAP